AASAAATVPAQTTGGASDPARPDAAQSAPAVDDTYFDKIYRKFNETYHLGAGDEISIHIKGQQAHSVEKVKVSPTGTIYHDLLGEVSVVGMTINQVTERLTNDLNEYLKNPQVIVQLIEAVSAKIGVLGEVTRPGIIVMSRPMSLLDAITEAGGFADTGSKSSVEVLRQNPNGSHSPMRVDVKKILEGKANPESNIQLRAGDLVVVHGNSKKTLATISTIAGFGSFVGFISRGW
ncbi:MAG: polysaccharide biosynthesis/export family protein, partial [Blastocatellia bacterium]